VKKWRCFSANVVYEYDCIVKIKKRNMQKEWHKATNPLKEKHFCAPVAKKKKQAGEQNSPDA
jgi:hypothetical protein